MNATAERVMLFQIKGALQICRAFAGRCRCYSKGEFKGEFKGRLGKYIDEMGGGVA